MESLDKNQSYFFLFNKETYTLEQVRSFTLEDCYRYCINDEWCESVAAEHKRQIEEQKRQMEARREEDERKLYEKLKKKYGDS